MKNTQILLKSILKLKKDLEAQGLRLPPGLAGMYGEILAYEKLEKHFSKKGVETVYFSGQKGADIQLRKKGKVINIEVKTSRLKKENPGVLYGFAINIKKCRHHSGTFNHPTRGKINGDFCYFDYLLAVAMPDNFKNAKLYVFPRAYIREHEKTLRNRSKQFSSVTHRLIFVEDERPGNTEITKFDRDLTKRRRKFKDAWNLIKLT